MLKKNNDDVLWRAWMSWPPSTWRNQRWLLKSWKRPECTGGWSIAALPEGMKDLKKVASCESLETESEYSRCIRQGMCVGPDILDEI